MNFTQQSACVTGANRGIGKAFCEMLAKEKIKTLYLVVRQHQPELEVELRSLGAQEVITWEADLSQASDLKKISQNLKQFKVDILFNNAGVLTGGLLEDQPLEDIDKLIDVNIRAVFVLTQSLLPNLIKQKSGLIINHASVSALMHFPCASTYAASKAAVLAFTNCLELELQGTGVRTLSLITPGIKTRMFDEIPKKYGAHINVPQESLSTEEYALQIRDAILRQQTHLWPRGWTAAGLWTARFLPPLFKKVLRSQFKRT